MSRHRRQPSQALPTSLDLSEDEPAKGATFAAIDGGGGADSRGQRQKTEGAVAPEAALPPPSTNGSKKKQPAGS
ncbi:hypothetical protein IEQ34_005946 [Dendrobium chrysotoxum]|uniref:Uncharacterized protein n=1 Tax=Dendrobium chrysotoxum TaxID=161865 RepID=A0AAV7HEF4_DENCH|nr:hypothetical protein IEQ34_005946 [Dendrobium chrysotoxum]